MNTFSIQSLVQMEAGAPMRAEPAGQPTTHSRTCSNSPSLQATGSPREYSLLPRAGKENGQRPEASPAEVFLSGECWHVEQHSSWLNSLTHCKIFNILELRVSYLTCVQCTSLSHRVEDLAWEEASSRKQEAHVCVSGVAWGEWERAGMEVPC